MVGWVFGGRGLAAANKSPDGDLASLPPGYYPGLMPEQNPSPPPSEAPVDPLFSHAASPFVRTEAPPPVAFASPPATPPIFVSTYTTYRSQINFGLLLIAFLMVLMGSATIVQASPAADWKYIVAGLPVIPAALVVWLFVRAIARLDEVQKRMHMQAFGFSLGGTALLTFGYGFLEGAGLPQLSWTLVAPLIALLWGLGIGILALRQRFRI